MRTWANDATAALIKTLPEGRAGQSGGFALGLILAKRHPEYAMALLAVMRREVRDSAVLMPALDTLVDQIVETYPATS